MKTVVIVHHTGDWGGGTKSLIDLCEMLRDEYNVIVCIPKGFPRFREKIIECGCNVHEMAATIPFVNVYSGSPPLVSMVTLKSLRSLLNIKKTGKEILSLEPDVVIFNTMVTAITARFLSRKTKVICIDRETLTSRISKALYRGLLDKHLKAITFLSEFERKKLDFRKAETVVFPDCVHTESIREYDAGEVRKKEKIPENRFVLLFMGGLAKIKGPDVIFEAIERLDDRFLLVIAGKIDEKQLSDKQLRHDIKYPSIYRFKKKLKKAYLSVKGSSKIVESGLRDSVDELIVASDVVVFPSTSVHQPRPCIEAGIYKKPVIISDYEETKEYFIDGYNALTFRPCDSKELAERITYAFEHKDELKVMGENNRLMTVSKHSYLECKTIICSLIERICDASN